MQAALEVIDAADKARALLDPTRLELLEQFREPRSAAEAARALKLPRQRIGHHVRLLKNRKLLRAVGERRKGNFVEQLLQATARAYVIAPQALGAVGAATGELRDRFSSAYLLAAASRTIGDVSRLQQLAQEQNKKLATMTLEAEVRFSSPSRQSEFVEELTACIVDLACRYHDEAGEGGRRFRFTLSGHPTLPPETLPQESGPRPERGEAIDET